MENKEKGKKKKKKKKKKGKKKKKKKKKKKIKYHPLRGASTITGSEIEVTRLISQVS